MPVVAHPPVLRRQLTICPPVSNAAGPHPKSCKTVLSHAPADSDEFGAVPPLDPCRYARSCQRASASPGSRALRLRESGAPCFSSDPPPSTSVSGCACPGTDLPVVSSMRPRRVPRWLVERRKSSLCMAFKSMRYAETICFWQFSVNPALCHEEPCDTCLERCLRLFD